MQTLIFNTTDKTVTVYNGHPPVGILIYEFDNIPTVKVQVRFYEVMQKDGSVSSIPILRLPICSTNMRIIR
jgi:peroxiredoxin